LTIKRTNNCPTKYNNTYKQNNYTTTFVSNKQLKIKAHPSTQPQEKRIHDKATDNRSDTQSTRLSDIQRFVRLDLGDNSHLVQLSNKPKHKHYTFRSTTQSRRTGRLN
jgi:hypothetical protein